MEKKILFIILRVIITAAAFIVGGYVLYKFEYFGSFGDIDNVVGMLPVVLVMTGVGGITAILWMKHTKRFIPVSAALTLFAILSVILFPAALRGNWWLNVNVPKTSEAKPDLTVFIPFSEKNFFMKYISSPFQISFKI